MDYKESNENYNEINSIPEILDKANLCVIKITSQKNNKFFIFEKDKIIRYRNLIITRKLDAVDEIISVLNKKIPNWYFMIAIDSKNPTLFSGRKRLYEYISYDCPRYNDIINDPGNDLFFVEDNKSYFNLFQNSYYLSEEGRSKLEEKDWSIIQKVIWNLSGENEENYEWIINWLATLYQYPTYRFTTSLVFIGQKGSGKGMLAKVIRFIFGNTSYTANSRDLTSNFNAQLFEGKVVLLANEILDQHNKFQFSNNLKEFITENIISVEKKFCDRYLAKNYIKLILFSNSLQPISIEEDDRRYAVFNSSKKINEIIDFNSRSNFFEDKKFFKNQCEGFAYYLLNYIIDDSKVVDEPIMTPAKKDIININLTDFRFIVDEIIEENKDYWREDLKGLWHIKFIDIFNSYLIMAQNHQIPTNKIYPKNKFGTKLRLEMYKVYNMKSIQSEKTTWVQVPYRIIKKVFKDKKEIIEKVKRALEEQKKAYYEED